MFEYKPPQNNYIWRRDSFSKGYISDLNRVFLYITEKCNLKCRGCYVGAGEESCIQGSYSFFRDAILSVKAFGAKSVSFMGGEPTIHPAFFQLLKDALDQDLHVVIDSNGDIPAFRTVERIVREIPNATKRIRLNYSIDSHIEEKHNLARGEQNNYRNLLQTIKLAKDSGFKVSTSTTVTSETVDEVTETFDFLEGLGVDEANIHILSFEGRARKHPELLVQPSKWLSTITEIHESGPRNTLSLRFPIVFLPNDRSKAREYMEKFQTKDVFRCIGSKNADRIGIRPNGSVHVCALIGFTGLAAFRVTPEGNLIKVKKERSELDLYKYTNKHKSAGCQATTEMNELYPGYKTLCRSIKVVIPSKSHGKKYFEEEYPHNQNFLMVNQKISSKGSSS